MPKYVIERQISGVGGSTADEPQAAANRISEARTIIDPTTAEA